MEWRYAAIFTVIKLRFQDTLSAKRGVNYCVVPCRAILRSNHHASRLIVIKINYIYTCVLIPISINSYRPTRDPVGVARWRRTCRHAVAVTLVDLSSTSSRSLCPRIDLE